MFKFLKPKTIRISKELLDRMNSYRAAQDALIEVLKKRTQSQKELIVLLEEKTQLQKEQAQTQDELIMSLREQNENLKILLGKHADKIATLILENIDLKSKTRESSDTTNKAE